MIGTVSVFQDNLIFTGRYCCLSSLLEVKPTPEPTPTENLDVQGEEETCSQPRVCGIHAAVIELAALSLAHSRE